MVKLAALVASVLAGASLFGDTAQGQSSSIYSKPTYAQVMRLIAAAKGEDMDHGPWNDGSVPASRLYSTPTYAQVDELIKAVKEGGGGGGDTNVTRTVVNRIARELMAYTNATDIVMSAPINWDSAVGRVLSNNFRVGSDGFLELRSPDGGSVVWREHPSADTNAVAGVVEDYLVRTNVTDLAGRPGVFTNSVVGILSNDRVALVVDGSVLSVMDGTNVVWRGVSMDAVLGEFLPVIRDMVQNIKFNVTSEDSRFFMTPVGTAGD